jgi:DNA-binding MarR family transcriptional regulator
MSESSYGRTANLLGALAVAVWGRLREATEYSRGGLVASEPAALVALAHHPDQSIETLRQTLDLTHSGAVRLVDRIESAGLARRIPSGHGRTLALRLTPSGRRAAAAVLARRQSTIEGLIEPLDPDDRAALARIAECLLAGLTSDRRSAHRICRLCDESLCVRGAECPVDRAASG